MSAPIPQKQLAEVIRSELGIIAPQIPTSELSWETTVAELGIDSLLLLELVAAVEDRLGVPLPDDELVAVRTLSDLADVANRQLAAAPGRQTP